MCVKRTRESDEGERGLDRASAGASADSLVLGCPGLLLVELLSRLLSLIVPGNERPFRKLQQQGMQQC